MYVWSCKLSSASVVHGQHKVPTAEWKSQSTVTQ